MNVQWKDTFAKDVSGLDASGHTREVSTGTPNCVSFTVLEQEKQRRRWIVHPKEFNEQVEHIIVSTVVGTRTRNRGDLF